MTAPDPQSSNIAEITLPSGRHPDTTPPERPFSNGIKCLTWSCWNATKKKDLSMEKITTVGLDLAKSVFQVHGITEEGAVIVRRALRRSQVSDFFASCSLAS